LILLHRTVVGIQSMLVFFWSSSYVLQLTGHFEVVTTASIILPFA